MTHDPTALGADAFRGELGRPGLVLAGLLDALEEVTVGCDAAGVLSFFNRAASELVGREAERVAPELRPQLYRLYGPDAALLAPEELPLVRALREGSVDDIEILVERPSGERRTLVGRGRRLADPDGSVCGAVVTLRDVTDERAAARQLREQTLHDPLTGLASRPLLQDQVGQALGRAGRSGWTTALLAVDIDRFSKINDSLGHEIGDGVLVEVARRLETTVRSYDTIARPFTVARLGGDEFFVLCEGVEGERAATSIALRLGEAISMPMEVAGHALRVSASVGVALWDGAARDPEELVLGAEVAMRQAKSQGPGRQVFLPPALTAAARDLGESEAALGRALAEDQFHLVYQPILLLATGQITGVEALLRWEHPRHGPVAPGEFIPLAERNGLIVPIGAWVIERACRQAAFWQEEFPTRPPLHVSVNVSGRQFDEDIVGVVARALDGARLGAGLLRLEVTESTVMRDVGAAVATLENLRALGVTISIDDFGTGYSSLASLRLLPLDELKVDKSFVDGLGRDPECTAIVAAIVGMAHALDRVVVAEGVETDEQLDALRTFGCDYAQGYFFARPQDPAALHSLLLTEAEASWSGHRAERPAPAVQAGGTYRSPRVVVADDTPTVLQLARVSLTTAGFDVHEASTGQEAIALVEQLRPDCVILDVMMPDMDGFTVCRALRANPASADCTIVMLTATSSPDSKAVAFLAGADDYIVKPFAPRDLVSRVRAAMNLHPRTDGS